jgi:hypothetical protein
MRPLFPILPEELSEQDRALLAEAERIMGALSFLALAEALRRGHLLIDLELGREEQAQRGPEEVGHA